jgi:hypothetical protein
MDKFNMNHLIGKCADKVCQESKCPEAAKQGPNGRFYITMGHAGFNCKPNNGAGFLSEDNARRTIQLYLRKS